MQGIPGTALEADHAIVGPQGKRAGASAGARDGGGDRLEGQRGQRLERSLASARALHLGLSASPHKRLPLPYGCPHDSGSAPGVHPFRHAGGYSPLARRARPHVLAADRYRAALADSAALRPQLGCQQPPTSRRARDRLRGPVLDAARRAAPRELPRRGYRPRLAALAQLAAQSALLRLWLLPAVLPGRRGPPARLADQRHRGTLRPAGRRRMG